MFSVLSLDERGGLAAAHDFVASTANAGASVEVADVLAPSEQAVIEISATGPRRTRSRAGRRTSGW